MAEHRRPRVPYHQGAGRPALTGAAAAAAGALAWALAAAAAGRQPDLLAALVGTATGMAVARGITPPPRLQAAAAALAVAGCAAGTLLAVAAIPAVRHGAALQAMLGHPGIVLRDYPGAVGWPGLMFWAVAAAAAAFPPRRRAAAPPAPRRREQSRQHRRAARTWRSSRPGPGLTAPREGRAAGVTETGRAEVAIRRPA